MARRPDRKTIKLEAAYGSDRQSIVVKRNQDLIVHDLMEEVQRVFKIPVDEQVIFHKGTNLCDHISESLESLGIESNHHIRVTRDPQLPLRTGRRSPQLATARQMGGQQGGYGGGGGGGGGYPYQMGGGGGNPQDCHLGNCVPGQCHNPNCNCSPMYGQSYPPTGGQGYGNMGGGGGGGGGQDVLKLHANYGSDREYILVHGRRPLCVGDLKQELYRVFKIPPDSQCIVYKGYNVHDYLDEAPLDAFGMENNSQVTVWPRGSQMSGGGGGGYQDMRMGSGQNAGGPGMADMFSPRGGTLPPPGAMINKDGTQPGYTEVVKVEVQHGSDRHILLLKGDNKLVTVADMQQELSRVTNVPVKEQRLFFKSQELNLTPYKTLKECDIENNHVVQMVGDPIKRRYDYYFGRNEGDDGMSGGGGGGGGGGPMDVGAQQLRDLYGGKYATGGATGGRQQPLHDNTTAFPR